LVLEAIHGGGTHNIMGIHVPEISTQFSLAIIVTTLLVTIIASLARTSKSKVAE